MTVKKGTGKRICLLLCAAVLMAAALTSCLKASEKPEGPTELDIGMRRQFVWDESIIDAEKTTATRMMHSPVQQETVLTAGMPWEANGIGCFQLLQDADGCRMYYTAWDADGTARICLAESADGIVWEKPTLGLAEYDGARGNNILLDSGITALSVFVDPSPEAKKDERYKAVGVRDGQTLVGLVSPDGLAWTEKRPLRRKVTTCTDGPVSLHSAFYDAEQQRYFCYFMRETDAGQQIAVISSENFRRWSSPEDLSFEDGAAELSVQTANIFPYYREPGTLVGLPLRMTAWSAEELEANFPGNAASAEKLPEGKNTVLTDTVFLTSKNGVFV